MNPDEKILVLGTSDFLGSHLCETFIASDYQVRGFSRKPLKFCFSCLLQLPKIDWFVGDFNNPEDIHNALQGCTTIVHLVSPIPLEFLHPIHR